MVFMPPNTYMATSKRQPPVVWLEHLLYWNEWGERCNITNAFDEDGEDISLECIACVCEDAVVVVAEHPLAGSYTVDLREGEGDDETIVLEYAGGDA